MNKKIIAFGLACAFAVSMAAPVGAITDAEYQALVDQLAQLTALYNGLLAQTSVPTTSAAVCFNTDLSKGMTSNDVENLQIVLNKNASTQVASSGAGSPGSETAYFGSLTFTAVKNFQSSEGIINTGYVGPLTRAALNALYCTASVPSTTYPAGCTSAVGFSTTTGLSCSGAVTYPAGCTSAVGYSSTTGLSCSGTTTVGAGTEGNLAITQNPLPGSSTVILYGGNVQKEISAYKIKATNSDVRVKRVVLQFGITSDFPWRDISAVSIWDGSTMLKEVPATQANFTETTYATTYTMQLDGLDVLVAKDTEKVLSIKATAVSVPQYHGAMTVLIPANGMRGLDSLGLNVYGPATVLAAHTFTTAVAQAPTITTTASIDSPLAGNFIGSLTTITRIDLMKINLKVESVDMVFKGGKITVDTNGDNDTMSAVELYDGSTLLSSAAVAAPATVDLSTFTLPVSANTTKVLTVKGVIKSAPTAGKTVSISLPTGTGLIGIDSNGAAQTNTGAIVGNVLTVYTAAPVFSLASASVAKSASSTTTTNNVGDFTIGISITANSGDIYIPTTAHTTNGSSAALGTAKGILPTVSAGGGTQTATSSNWSCDSNAVEDTTSLVWRIPSGATSVCTYNYHVLNTTLAGWYNVSVLSVKWATNANMTTGLITQATGLSALKAPATLLNL